MIPKNHHGTIARLGLLALLAACLLNMQSALADSLSQEELSRRAELDYRLCKIRYQAGTNKLSAAWIFARACYNLADFSTDDDTRSRLANEGMEACQQLLKKAPKSAAAYYYLGMNQGQLARTEFLGALKLVRDMEREFKIAWSLDPHVDHGGPARSLGLLYRDAPGWPASIGSKRKAREWLERPARLEPLFPENLMVLSESYLKWDDYALAGEKLAELDKLWPRAQTNFTGAAWEGDWVDWTARRQAIRDKIAASAAAATKSVNQSN